MKKWEPLLLEIITKVSHNAKKIALQYVHDFDGLVIAFPLKNERKRTKTPTTFLSR
jgi:hypothetical protein